MKKPPRGKIGRLPKAIQEQVNRRRENGERARTLVGCLAAASVLLAPDFKLGYKHAASNHRICE